MSRKFRLTIVCDLGIGGERELDVTADYFYEKGCHTQRNGDPGWPATEEMNVERVILIDGKDKIDVTAWLAPILDNDQDLMFEVAEMYNDPDHD